MRPVDSNMANCVLKKSVIHPAIIANRSRLNLIGETCNDSTRCSRPHKWQPQH
jgi:hypothetical protein